jgi:hypothetical protein
MNINTKNKVNSLQKTYNLSHTVNFATRIQNSSSTAIDTIYIDNSKLSSSFISPIANGLSDHGAQFLTVNNIIRKVNLKSLKERIGKIYN